MTSKEFAAAVAKLKKLVPESDTENLYELLCEIEERIPYNDPYSQKSAKPGVTISPGKIKLYDDNMEQAASYISCENYGHARSYIEQAALSGVNHFITHRLQCRVFARCGVDTAICPYNSLAKAYSDAGMYFNAAKACVEIGELCEQNGKKDEANTYYTQALNFYSLLGYKPGIARLSQRIADLS